MKGCFLPVILFSLFGGALLTVGAEAAERETAFWVWHRKDPLSPQERTTLREMKASLLWHVGEFSFNADQKGAEPQWRFKEPNPEGRATPVLRLNLQGKNPFEGEAEKRLFASVVSGVDPEGRLQLDYDCPDRLLGSYAAFLKKVRKRAPELSITALAGWANKNGWRSLQRSVTGMDVMFYDLAADPATFSEKELPQSLLNIESFAPQLRKWRSCGVKWRAGLPNFARLTLFDADGQLKGHIRNWSWDDLIFQPRLKFGGSPTPGLVLLKCEEDLVLANTPLSAGSTLVVRWVDRGTLAEALKRVKRSRAQGPIFFRLPDSSDAGGWSLPQLTELMEGRVEAPQFGLRYEMDRFVLENRGKADVAPRIEGDGPDDRAYCVEIDAPVRSWREALPGDFWRVGAHSIPLEGPPVAVSVPLASRLTLWFSHLPSGEFLKSGLVQFAPGTDLGKVRYRISPGKKEWTPLEIVLPKVD